MKLQAGFSLKCGLEIHTQLLTKYKLFSLSRNDQALPNRNASFFDMALPGTQPNFNPEVLIQSLYLSFALNSAVNKVSTFDRKHYFYYDQPNGYQITQYFHPFSNNGFIRLAPKLGDNIAYDKVINIRQLQIEQDTGKTTRLPDSNTRLIDINRSNVPLIELVTQPDFNHIEEITAFIKKYQNLVRFLNISDGDLESGSLRVDVNVNINDFPIVELKNMPNTTSIDNAIQYEYQRQVKLISEFPDYSTRFERETRTWNGFKTTLLRKKSDSIDYRFLPDPELPPIVLSDDLINTFKSKFHTILLPDKIFIKLTSEPFNLSVNNAKILTSESNSNNKKVLYSHYDLQTYFFKLFENFSSLSEKEGLVVDSKIISNWLLNNLLKYVNKYNIPFNLLTERYLNPNTFAQFLILIQTNKITNNTAKLLLNKKVSEFQATKNNEELNFKELLEELNLKRVDNSDKLKEVCEKVIQEWEGKNPKLIQDIRHGKGDGKINCLIGSLLRLTNGRAEIPKAKKLLTSIIKGETNI